MNNKTLNFLENSIEEELLNIHTCMPAKILKYYPEKLKAEIELMFKKKYIGEDEAREYTQIINVPVSTIQTGNFIIRPPYKEGDMVLVIFSERALDNIMNTGNKADPDNERRFDITDAIIIHGLMPFTKELPKEHGNDLIISNKEFNQKITLKESGDIELEAGTIKIGENAEEGILLGDSAKEYLDNHTHPYTWTDSGGSGDTESPNEDCPEPSKKGLIEE